MTEAQQAPVNVVEDGTDVIVTIPLPGAIPDRTRIEVERDSITVTAAVAPEHAGVPHRQDWMPTPWEAETDLPASIDPTTVEVELVQGILTITGHLADVPADVRVVVQP